MFLTATRYSLSQTGAQCKTTDDIYDVNMTPVLCRQKGAYRWVLGHGRMFGASSSRKRSEAYKLTRHTRGRVTHRFRWPGTRPSWRECLVARRASSIFRRHGLQNLRYPWRTGGSLSGVLMVYFCGGLPHLPPPWMAASLLQLPQPLQRQNTSMAAPRLMDEGEREWGAPGCFECFRANPRVVFFSAPVHVFIKLLLLETVTAVSCHHLSSI